ncbi:MAG: hypothetical protein L3J38_01425 [Thiomicrorhabdus sp.]|nr:hypothetical protein [Thiomicrorhabdus sp.]
MSYNKVVYIKLISIVALCMCSFSVFSGVEDIVNTKHNLSASGPGTLKATTESRVCVFCHTPHGSTVAPNAPLWNRTLSNALYSTYSSDSFDGAATIQQPSGSSKLCLSCHDGALVIGDVNFANGVLGANIAMQGTDGDGTFTSVDELTGFTRKLGVNLGNDHPISFTYDTSLANADGELYDPTITGHIGNRVKGQPKAAVPLEDNQVQCITCHNPHTIDDKFLRLNRTQSVSHGTDGVFDPANDIVCLACHNKTGWATSAHSHSSVANETYTTTASDQRQFTNGIQVWQAACLNCHDTHTVTGARMLLREGTDSITTPKSGGNAAQEETCYQCHTINGGLNNILVGGVGNEVPDIETQFNLPFSKPITNIDQSVTSEQHSITDKDFMETVANLGNNRHAECTDCHNPHRIIKNQLFNADPTIPDAKAHHDHASTSAPHNNIISGALAGTWGVEPIYGSAEFGSNPTGFTVKSGYAGIGASDDVSSPYVTREYQICMKCHSNYAYGNNPPTIGPSIGLNNVTQYTNQAMEFQAPGSDQGERPGAIGAAANHRSWHPVMESTGRTLAVRQITSTTIGAQKIFNAPWQDDGSIPPRIGNQTMYCSDCHGSSSPFLETDVTTHNVEPAPDGAWGPHGSENSFILKGNWDTTVPDNAPEPDIVLGTQLCFRCHDIDAYSPAGAQEGHSGFSGPNGSNMHFLHTNLVGRLRCTWCHVAVPHGWRNKALLVDITNDPEAAGCRSRGEFPCKEAPYYQKAYLGGNVGGVNWRASGEWTAQDCNSDRVGCSGMGWMSGNDGSGTSCASPL